MSFKCFVFGHKPDWTKVPGKGPLGSLPPCKQCGIKHLSYHAAHFKVEPVWKRLWNV